VTLTWPSPLTRVPIGTVSTNGSGLNKSMGIFCKKPKKKSVLLFPWEARIVFTTVKFERTETFLLPFHVFSCIQIKRSRSFLCLWFRVSLIYINNCPTKCNTKQSIYYSASSLYMFRVSITPIIIKSTQNCNYSLRYWSYFLCSSFQRDQTWIHWREVAAQKIWPVPKAVVTALCIPDNGCGWHPKHVDRTCRIINRLLCVASRWTIISIGQEVFGIIFLILLEKL